MIERRELPTDWDADIQPFPADAKGMASRASSGKVLNQVAKHVPWLLGGSADLAPSTNTLLTFDGAGDFSAGNYAGRNFHFGIREHAMGAILQRHGPVRSAGLRGHVLRLHRLHAAVDPPGRHHGPAGVLRLHARFDRRGRRRPDAPADRASGRAAGDPQPAGDPPGRRQRSGRGVQGRHAAERSARRACADAAEPAHARPREIRLGRRAEARRL